MAPPPPSDDDGANGAGSGGAAQSRTSIDVTINGRYRLTRWIGRSVLADDYTADDVHLGREVVFKALLPSLVADRAFVDRFRMQAQAAANLNHPALNAVLDWGRDPGPLPDGRGGTRLGPTYYLIAEQPQGRSLAELVAANGPMPVERAAHVIVATTAALAFAHRSGCLHGGLTPDRVRVSSTGVVKVLDTGLASALGTAWLPDDSQVEAAPWMSPEQFGGGGITERSDVYQVGLLAYYLVTGRPPYAGESVAVLGRRHREEIPLAPSKLAPGLPKPFEAFIGRSMAKAADDRFGSVAAQRAAMVRVRDRLSARAGAGGPQDDATSIAPRSGAPDVTTVRVSSASATEAPPWSRPRGGETLDQGETRLVTRPPATETPDRTELLSRPSRRGAVDADGMLPSGPDRDFDELDDEPTSRARKGLFALTTIVLLGVLAGMIVLLGNQLRNSKTGNVAVPSVQQRPVKEAQDLLASVGLRVELAHVPSADVGADVVMAQTPTAGKFVAEGSLVTLTVSTGTDKPIVPNVVGLSIDVARGKLLSFGFAVERTDRQDDSVAEGTVTAQSPQGDLEAEKGATVTLQVAIASGVKEVPNLAGKTADEARIALTKEGFLTAPQNEPSNAVEKGIVIRTEPAGGSKVAKGSSVVIVVSGGKVITVPDVVGKDQASAIAALQQIGLVVSPKERVVTDAASVGRVVSQTPAPNQPVALGATVHIRIGIAGEVATTLAPTTGTEPVATSSEPLQTVQTAAPPTQPPTTAPPVPVSAVSTQAPAATPAPVPAAAATTVAP